MPGSTARDLHVVFGSQGQKTLEPGTGMLWPGPLQAMRQEQHQPTQPAPLVFGGDNELVDDHLRDIHEVAVLGFPHYKRRGAVERIAVLKPQHADLGKRAVDDFDRGLRGAQIQQRRIVRSVLEIMQHGMALTECAAFAILPTQAHRHVVRGQGGKCQGLGC